MRELLDGAPENYRRVLRLHFIEDRPIEAIVDEYLDEELQSHPIDRTDVVISTVFDRNKSLESRGTSELGSAAELGFAFEMARCSRCP